MRIPTVLACLLLAAAAQAQHAHTPLTRAYDVRFLTRKAVDSPGPALGFGHLGDWTGTGGPGVGIGGGDEEEGQLSLDALMNVIRDNVDPDSWEGEHTIKSREGLLVVRTTAARHAKIEAVLSNLRYRIARRVRLEVLVIEGPASAVSAALAGGPVLDGPRLAALQKAPWTAVRSARMSAFGGERTHVGSFALSRYLHDLDVSSVEKGATYEADLAGLRLGTVDDLRAVVSGDGRSVMVICRNGAAKTLGETAMFDAGLGDGAVPLEQPSLRLRKLRTCVWMPAAGACIVGGQLEDGKARLTIVRHLPSPPPPTPLPLPVDRRKRAHRLYDIRYLTLRALDFKGPPLNATERGGGGTGGAIFSEPEELAPQMTKEALVELMKSSLDPDSWENDRNSLDAIGGMLLAHQSTTVLDQIGRYIQRFDEARRISILVRARILQPGPQSAAWIAERAGEAVPAKDVERLEALIVSKQLRLLEDATITGLPTYRCYASATTNRPYVRGLSLADKATTSHLDPDVEHFEIGTVLDVRPTPLADRKRVLLDLRIYRAELAATSVLNVGGKGRVQVPTLHQRSRAVNIIVADGGNMLIDLAAGRYALIEVAVSRGAKK